MRLFTDMMGRPVLLTAAQRRIVSLVPSQTELLHDLGLEDEVVGITKFCIHPQEWFRNKTRIGGTKQVHIDKIAALQPGLILANKEENVRGQIEELSRIAPVWVSDIKTLEDALAMIRQVGLLVDKEARATEIADAISNHFSLLPEIAATGKKVAYGIWRDPWMWAGGDTFIHDILQRAGWRNALAEVDRYPAINLETLRDYHPEIILLSSEPYPFKEQHLREVATYLPDAQVMLVDGEVFSWYGSRLLHTVPYLQTLIQQIA